MLWAAYHSSSGALTVLAASGLYMHVVTGRCPGWVGTVPIHFPLSLYNGQSPYWYINQRLQIVCSCWWWEVCRSKHVELLINFGIINSITRLHLVGYFYWYRTLSSSLCSFLHSHVTSSLLGPNILLYTLFSNTLNLFSFHSVTEHVSHSYKTKAKFLLAVLKPTNCQTICIERRALWEPNTSSVKKFRAFLCSQKYTVWTSQQIVAEPEKFPILLGKAIPVRSWRVPEGSRKLSVPEFLNSRHMNLGSLSAVRTGRLFSPKITLVLICGSTARQ
jgi:hypothetical protein